MSAATANTPANIIPGDEVDVEPDDAWKAALKARIDEGFQSVVREAKVNLEIQLRQPAVTPADRERLNQEYYAALNKFRRLASENFQEELNSERAERAWAAGRPMHPAQLENLQRRQRSILVQIKEAERQPAESPVEERRPSTIPVFPPNPIAVAPTAAAASLSYPPRIASELPELREPLPLPPELREPHERHMSAKKARRDSDTTHGTTPRDDLSTNSLRTRSMHPPVVHERPSLPSTWTTSAPTEEPDVLSSTSLHSRPSVDRSPTADGLPRSFSERHTVPSPSRNIPEIWRPSISPEEDAATSKPSYLARQGSVSSMRSFTSGMRGASLLERERLDEIPKSVAGLERDKDRGRDKDWEKEVSDKERQHDSDLVWDPPEKARERHNSGRSEAHSIRGDAHSARGDSHPGRGDALRSNTYSVRTDYHSEAYPAIRSPASDHVSRYDELGRRPAPPAVPDERYRNSERPSPTRAASYMHDPRDGIQPHSTPARKASFVSVFEENEPIIGSMAYSRPLAAKNSFSDVPFSSVHRPIVPKMSFHEEYSHRKQYSDERERFAPHYGPPLSSISSSPPVERYPTPPSSATRAPGREHYADFDERPLPRDYSHRPILDAADMDRKVKEAVALEMKILEMKKLEMEACIKEEDIRRKEEEARQKEIKMNEKAEEVRRLEEDARRMEDEVRKKDREAQLKSEEVEKLEKLAQKKEEYARQREEDVRRWEERLQKREEELRRREEALQQEEERQRQLRDKTQKELEETLRQMRLKHAQLQEEEKERAARPTQAQQDGGTTADGVKTHQQEEFQKRAEDIDRRRAGSFRKDSVGSESVPGSSSSGAVPVSPQRSPSTSIPGHPDRISTSGSSTRSSAWSSSTKTTTSTLSGVPPASNSSTDPATTGWTSSTTPPGPKPRTASISANNAAPPPVPPNPVTEGEWARARKQQQQQDALRREQLQQEASRREEAARREREQQEAFRKEKEQQEAFRQEQERLEAARLMKEAGKLTSREEASQVFERHEWAWSKLTSKDTLSWTDFPWPMFRRPSAPDDITVSAINAYVSSPHYPEKDRNRQVKDRVKDNIKRWHPDRFETKLLTKVVEPDREKVKEGAGVVVRYLNDLLMRFQGPSLFG